MTFLDRQALVDLLLTAGSAAVTVFIGLILIRAFSRSQTDKDPAAVRPTNWLVLVLGDIGHSPRMNLHALSMADKMAKWSSSSSSKVAETLSKHPNLTMHRIQPPQKITAANPVAFLVAAGVRVVKQLGQLVWLLFFQMEAPEIVLVQNPPAIPTLMIAQLLRLIRGSKLIIDWHNFGFSIMAMGKPKGNKIVRIAKWYEMTLGRFADGHLCVTKAMAQELKSNWNIRTELTEKQSQFMSTMEIRDGKFDYKSTSAPFPVSTLLTCQMTPTSPSSYRTKRPAVLVSSTSWTPDEDFSILLSALVEYDETADAGHADLVVIVTGKGPQKQMYQERVSKLALRKVKIVTAWLSSEDYPKLLGSADLGVCLHTSSSGLDLPMKVVDMFGCGLPVCAVGYPCLNELVHHDVNGLVFADASELCQQLLRLFDGFSKMNHESELQVLARGTKAFQAERWPENWEKNVGSVFFDSPLS
ncbi:mannosyltransferase [Podochytrium sp. JEL0797]|nr:mannosyltransferase [Podochytrium sp. JEL0797]